MLSTLRRLGSWLVKFDHPTEANDETALMRIDGNWHGDHWQNLLCSPMDARHYVMEDWSVQAPVSDR